MNQIITYLTFNGNCRQAMEFYRECLDGELQIQTLADTPEGRKFPEKYRRLVVQASLKKGGIVLMGTDLHDEQISQGNAISILLNGTNKLEILGYYKKLQIGGEATHPLRDTIEGGAFGGLTDRFGNHWLFHYKQP